MEHDLNNPLPSGTVTMMFTDIVNSTDIRQLSGRDNDERNRIYVEQIQTPHHSLVCECIAQYGGRKVKTIDDSFFVVFQDAAKAVRCAVTIQQRLADTKIPTPMGDLQIRIGLNTGAPICQENDYAGIEVIKAERIAKSAGGGQIFLSRETWGLVEGNISDLRFHSRGSCDLKGLGKHDIYEVLWNDKQPGAPKVSKIEEVKERINPQNGAVMVYIPEGEFLMGDNDLDRAQPQCKVHLDGYWIYKYPVTVAQYRKFCEATKREMPPAPGWGWKDDHPIVKVMWPDAVAYCEWAGVRLPTEAEWEKAARGTDGREFPWGDEWDGSKCANSVEPNSLSSTVAVGRYPQGASPYGVLHMAGNVWEWCSSLYEPYPYDPNDGREDLTASEARVLRGGAWFDKDEVNFRCAFRVSGNLPVFGYFPCRGFRCVTHADFR